MLFILDRDGVINFESEAYVKSPDEWIPIPGSIPAIAQLNQAGHKIVVATNQAGVGRGIYSLEAMHATNAKMLDLVLEAGGCIEKVYYCPHHPDEKCYCRKPEPGMLLEIKRDYPQDFAKTLFVGDSWRDIEAARKVGVKVALVKTGYGLQTIKEALNLEGVTIYADLAEFADKMLSDPLSSSPAEGRL